MAATIKIKNSSTTGAVPTSGDLVQGELAVNVTDTGLYTENASGTVVKLNAPSIDDKNTGATKHLTISTGGNLGLGVTPNTFSVGKAVQVGPAGGLTLFGYSGGAEVGGNFYYDSAYKYVTTGGSARFTCGSNVFTWNIAPSGSAGGTITYTQAMTLDASGNLGVGSTSPNLGGVNKAITLNSATSTNCAYELAVNGTLQGSLYTAVASSSLNLATWVNGPLTFITNSTERARIDSSGRWLVNTTAYTSGANCFAEIYGGNSSKAGLNIRGDGASGTRYFTSFFVGTNTNVGAISSDGSTTTYGTTSDYRLKENIAPMTGALATVAQLRPCTYSWKSTGAAGQGFIAHELQEVVADAVVGEKDAVETYTDEEGNQQTRPVYQGIDTSFLVATLTAAIQELKAIVDAQAVEIAALKGQA